ncbi:hypothetical protein [Vibrio phage JSF12]|uniref:Uncharacterized protein n=2 Tax=Jesfedecavirus TaxID=2560156 RepID=A0A2D0YNE2_9CAUD|nr:hypothetical protein FDI98_gp140 [Vibrio phage JSF10]YP_009794721.1 hypothetical protein HOS35_gp038 [Vibrio phage JSF12]ASV43392.1 hypothetical protein [Vibrio phage JSF10]ASV43556.1 hypothetical protein [Vibrio phage JSF12]
MSKADWWEYYSVAEAVLGMDENSDEELVEEELQEVFGVSFDQFCSIASALLPLTPPIKTYLGERVVNAFVTPVEGGYVALVQQEYKHEKKIDETK